MMQTMPTKENPTTPKHWREEPWKRCDDEKKSLRLVLLLLKPNRRNAYQ
jgi:hypothetical protein